MPAEREVFHFAALLVFQGVSGGAPLLPRPVPVPPPPPPPPPTEAGPDRRFSWARVLLNAVRGEIPSEAVKCLSDLQREIEVMHFFQNLLGGGG